MNNNILKLNRKIKLFFSLSLIFSILGVLSIPGIIFGATKSLWPLLIISIIFAVHAFYGLVFWWTYYLNLKQRLVILKLIEQQNYYNTAEISTQLAIDETLTQTQIKWLITKGYLDNYFYDGNVLTLNQRKKQEKEQSKYKCPCCGSNLTTTNNSTYCEYCGYKK